METADVREFILKMDIQSTDQRSLPATKTMLKPAVSTASRHPVVTKLVLIGRVPRSPTAAVSVPTVVDHDPPYRRSSMQRMRKACIEIPILN